MKRMKIRDVVKIFQKLNQNSYVHFSSIEESIELFLDVSKITFDEEVNEYTIGM